MAGAGQPSRDVGEPQPARSRRIDDLDRKIIQLLQRNGRTSNTEIARALDTTETTIRKRINYLLEERLMSIVAVPTPEAADMNLSAIIGLSVGLTSMHEIANELRRYQEVRYVGMSAGRYDIMLEAFFTNQEHLLEFVTHKLGPLPGITDIESSIILKVVKFSYEWEIA